MARRGGAAAEWRNPNDEALRNNEIPTRMRRRRVRHSNIRTSFDIRHSGVVIDINHWQDTDATAQGQATTKEPTTERLSANFPALPGPRLFGRSSGPRRPEICSDAQILLRIGLIDWVSF